MTHANASTDLGTLLGLLDLEQIGEDAFRGYHPKQVGSRTFGGQLVSQALMAAGRTVDGDRPIHAVNAHFIRGGDVKAPIEYRVDRHRDGRAFANRQVTAYQGENELFVMLAAFQDSGKGLDHAVEIPDVPLPESLPPIGDHLVGYEEKLPHFSAALKPIDMRYANDPAWILKAPARNSTTIGCGCAPTVICRTIRSFTLRRWHIRPTPPCSIRF